MVVFPNIKINLGLYITEKRADGYHNLLSCFYPVNWCANNKHGKLGKILDSNLAEFDYAKSVSNLTPLTRESNNAWRAKTPGLALSDNGITFGSSKSRMESHFITAVGFQALTADEPDPLTFWESRASAIAKDLRSRCIVEL